MRFSLQRRRAWTALVSLLLACNAGLATATPLDHFGHHHSFVHLDREDGLGDDTAYAVLQDQTGFLWLGTEGGLVRYDGYHLVPFRQNSRDAEELTLGVSDLVERQDGSLWIATWGEGLLRRDPADGSLTRFLPIPDQPDQREYRPLQDGRVQTLLEDHQGTLWVGTFSEGLARLEPGASEFKFYHHDPQDSHSLPSNRVWDLVEDPDGNLWIGTDLGLAMLDPKRLLLTRWQHDPQDPSSLMDNQVRALLIDREGVLWVGSRQGLDRFAEGQFQHHRPAGPGTLSYEIVNTLLEDHRGGLWIGTQGGGLNYLDPTRQHFEHFTNDPEDPSSLHHNDVRTLLEDRHHNLWIGTRGGGVDRLDLKRGAVLHFNHHPEDPDSLSDPMIRDLARDRRGHLWLATPRGLDRYDSASGTFRHFRHDPEDPRSLRYTDANAILASMAGDLWVTSFDSLSRFLGDDRGFEHFTLKTEPNGPQAWVVDLVDTTDFLWLGTTRGLWRFELATSKFSKIPLTPLGPTPWITALDHTLDGRLWVATQRGAVLLLDPLLDPHSTHAELLRQPTEEPILALHVTTDSRLWIGLRGALEEFDAAQVTRRHTTPRLATSEIVAVLEETPERLWLSTSDGMWLFDRPSSEFHRLVGGPPTSRFSSASLVEEGRFMVGSNNGFYMIEPASFITQVEPPNVVLTGFTLADQPMDLGQPLDQVRDITLTAKDRFISLEFTALEYTPEVPHFYRYRLSGGPTNSEWVELGEERTVQLTNLEAGDYSLQVQATGSNPQWQDSSPHLRLLKSPPWWRTLWFQFFACAFALVALASFGGLRRRRLQAREQRLNERIADAIADLERSEARYRALFERNLAGVVRVLLDGRILECNSAFAQIFGYPDALICRQQLRLAFNQGGAELRRKLETSGQVVGYEWTVETAEGSELTLLWNAILTYRRDGKPLIEGTVIDLSARRRAESRLERARKLESLGLLAGGIAHDFNNLLTGVLGQTELARQDVVSGSRLSLRLDRIESAAEKAATLSRQMLAYAGRAEAALEPVDLAQVIQRNRSMLQELAGPRVDVRLNLVEELPTVDADAAQLTQVLLNLVRNAAEAISEPAAGTIIITTGIADLGTEELSRLILGENLVPGCHVYLQVSDTGHGMEEATRSRIFDPFFSTRFTGRGLGLATVFGIVKVHMGAIEVESKRGRGTRLRILFPAVSIVASGTEELEPWTDEEIERIPEGMAVPRRRRGR